MPDGATPEIGPADRRLAADWLARHGLAGEPTPLLNARLAARGRVTFVDSLVLGALFIAASLAVVGDLFPTSAQDGSSRRVLWLALLTAVLAALLLAQILTQRWTRRADRQAGQGLARRATHHRQLGWRDIVGPGDAWLAAGAFTASLTLALIGGGYASVVTLVALAGCAVSMGVRLRDLWTRPIIAEDETSLTADLVMRVEDAREAVSPVVPLSLPLILMASAAPTWWIVAAFILPPAGVVALIVIRKRTPPCTVVARRAMIAP